MKVRALAVVFALSQSADAQSAPVLKEVMRIDGAQEDLTGTAAFVVLRDKRVAYFDPQNAQFVFFDSTGKRIGKFGAKGEGPGEFAPTIGTNFALRAGRIGDTLWTFSLGQRRFTLIGPDFRLIRTFNLPQLDAASIVSFTVLSALGGERAVGRATFGERVPVTLADGRASSTNKVSDSAIVVLAANGTVERRLAAAPPDSGMTVINRPGEQYRFAPTPFRRPPMIATSATGDYVAIVTLENASATKGSYRVLLTRSSGATVYSKAFTFAPTAITQRMRDSAFARMDSIYGRGRMAEMGGAELLKLMRERTPEVLPPFGSVEVGDDGSVWMRKNISDALPAEYVVLTPNGTSAPVVKLPGKMRLRVVSGTSIWATELDADGFVSIVRLNIGK